MNLFDQLYTLIMVNFSCSCHGSLIGHLYLMVLTSKKFYSGPSSGYMTFKKMKRFMRVFRFSAGWFLIYSMYEAKLHNFLDLSAGSRINQWATQ